MKYLILLFIVTVLLLTSCTGSEDESDWTILIYMAADNGLTNAAIEDINEMEKASFSEDVNVVVQIDYNSNILNGGTYRYKIEQDDSEEINSRVISTLGEIDSGDYAELRKFIDWGYSRYPSEKKALVIWSHGSGWYNFYDQFCPDHQSQNAINIPAGDLRSALQGKTGLDILMLDACFMQTIEVLTEIDYAFDYVIGSEDYLCGDGFPYDDILNDWESHLQTAELSMSINNLLYESYLPMGSQNPSNFPVPISCSTFNTVYLNELLAKLEDFSTQWSESANESYFTAARADCFEFNALEADVDLKQFLIQLQQRDLPEDLWEDCESLLQTLDNAFVSQEYYNYPADNIGTAVIWFPNEQFDYESLHLQYEELLFAETGWSIFLENSLLD